MSSLSTYLKIIESCRKHELAVLQKTLGFCNTITTRVKEILREKGIKSLKMLNVLDYNGLDEPQTSQIIKEILSYENNGDYPVWHSFVNTFIPEIANKVTSPIFSAEEQHIDVWVRERGLYTIIIENKLKGAAFQRNQLGRYVKKMLDKGYAPENIYLVLLPGWIDNNFLSHIRYSAWRAPKDWMTNNSDRKCCDLDSEDQYSCWCDREQWNIATNEWCRECQNCRDLFVNNDRISVIDRMFPEWLVSAASDDKVIPSTEIFLRSAMIQFADYINELYNTRLNIQEVMVIIEELMQDLSLNPQTPEENLAKVSKTLEDINSLQQSLKTLEAILRMRVWQNEVGKEFPDARIDTDDFSFGILLNGLYCGVWIEDDNRLYWGFYRNPDKIYNVDDIERMVKAILEQCPNCPSRGPKNDFIAWNYTDKGAENIAELLTAAEKSGYKYQRK